ncbi:MAG: Fur family transcriptional regulator [Pseudomonadota bacterium]|nr:Fur family transcriptional regulator [Pseudomonadota bacterium]
MAKALFPAPDHDHARCVDHGMRRAHDVFEQRGERLTKLREAVFRTLAESHEALGAYQIIEKLREKGRRIAPISMYRVLGVLQEAGLVHRIESRNAFAACHGGACGTRPVLFLVCDSCGRVAETEDDSLGDQVRRMAKSANFQTKDTVLEVRGQCAHCAR